MLRLGVIISLNYGANMDRQLTYLFGYPASGKSTAVAAALKDVPIISEETNPFKFTQYANGYQIGAKRERKSGTDALSYSVQPQVLEFMEQNPASVIAEGDRLANTAFFRKLIYAGWSVDLILLDVPVEIAQKRCFQRRSSQSYSWFSGRVTKTQNLKQRWKRIITVVDGTKPVEEVAAIIQSTKAVRQLNGFK